MLERIGRARNENDDKRKQADQRAYRAHNPPAYSDEMMLPAGASAPGGKLIGIS
jgi:hypothetical protein